MGDGRDGAAAWRERAFSARGPGGVDARAGRRGRQAQSAGAPWRRGSRGVRPACAAEGSEGRSDDPPAHRQPRGGGPLRDRVRGRARALRGARLPAARLDVGRVAADERLGVEGQDPCAPVGPLERRRRRPRPALRARALRSGVARSPFRHRVCGERRRPDRDDGRSARAPGPRRGRPGTELAVAPAANGSGHAEDHAAPTTVAAAAFAVPEIPTFLAPLPPPTEAHAPAAEAHPATLVVAKVAASPEKPRAIGAVMPSQQKLAARADPRLVAKPSEISFEDDGDDLAPEPATQAEPEEAFDDPADADFDREFGVASRPAPLPRPSRPLAPSTCLRIRRRPRRARSRPSRSWAS